MEPFLFEEPWFRAIIGLMLGLILGSFLTMLTYRVPRGLSIVRPPSSCPSCKTRLRPRDLIPVLSWAINRGRCRICQTKMSNRYVLIELASALINTFIIVWFGLTLVSGVTILLSLLGMAFVIFLLERKF